MVWWVHSLVALVLIDTYMYGWNLYMRKRARINYTFIFEFSYGSELHYEEVLVVCTTLTTMLTGVMVMHSSIHSMLFHAQASADVDLIPVAVMLVGCKTGYPHVLKSTSGLKKIPNQICSRPVKCNASCLINLRTWKHFLVGQFRGLPWFQWFAIELPHVLRLLRSFGVDSFSFLAPLGRFAPCDSHAIFPPIDSRSVKMTNEWVTYSMLTGFFWRNFVEWLIRDEARKLAKSVDLAILDKSEILYLGRCWIRYRQRYRYRERKSRSRWGYLSE